MVSPAAPDVTYPAFLELSSSAESRTELILIITCVIIMVIAVVDAIIALIVGLISDIVQLATGPPGFLELGERFLGEHATVRLPSAQSMLEDALNTGSLGGVTGGLGGGLGGRAGGPAAAASSLLQVGEGARGKAKNRFLISVSGGCQKAIGCLGVKAMKIGFKWWIGTMQEFGDIMTGQAKMKPKKKDIENANKKPTNKDSDAMSTFLSLRDGDDDPLQLVGRSLRGLQPLRRRRRRRARAAAVGRRRRREERRDQRDRTHAAQCDGEGGGALGAAAAAAGRRIAHRLPQRHARARTVRMFLPVSRATTAAWTCRCAIRAQFLRNRRNARNHSDRPARRAAVSEGVPGQAAQVPLLLRPLPLPPGPRRPRVSRRLPGGFRRHRRRFGFELRDTLAAAAANRTDAAIVEAAATTSSPSALSLLEAAPAVVEDPAGAMPFGNSAADGTGTARR